MSEKPKVFFIGKNKTATTSLHYLFQKCGYVSYHCLAQGGGHLGRIMERNVKEEKPILETISKADVYSDMLYAKKFVYVDAAQYFKILHHEYPDAYFVLQTRNTEAWVKSRCKHKRGDFLRRVMKFNNIKTKHEMQEVWRQEKEKHEEKVRSYFSGVQANFIEFNIDTDEIEKVIDFVSPHYTLYRKNYGHKNKTPT